MSGKLLYTFNAQPHNLPKIALMLAREILMFVSLVVLSVIMRPLRQYPRFFNCELSPDPWFDGIRAFDG